MKSLGSVLRAIVSAVEDQGNFASAANRASPHVKELLDFPDLLANGIERRGFHVIRSSWLYYDPEFSITVAEVPGGSEIPVHNHGTWEIVAPYRGSVQYTSYRRSENPTGPGKAELEVVEARLLEAGDIALVPPPPHDIHGWTVLTDTYLLGIVGPGVSTTRSYFDPGRSSYFDRNARWPSVE